MSSKIDGTEITQSRNAALRFTNRKTARLVAEMESAGATSWSLRVSAKLDGFYALEMWSRVVKGPRLGFVAASRFA